MQGMVPETAATKQQHTKDLQKLIAILNNSEPPMVANGGPLRVSPAASTPINVISPRVIGNTQFLHQHQTRNNTPIPIILEEETEGEYMPPDSNIERSTSNSTTKHKKMVQLSQFGMI